MRGLFLFEYPRCDVRIAGTDMASRFVSWWVHELVFDRFKAKLLLHFLSLSICDLFLLPFRPLLQVLVTIIELQRP